MQCGTGFLQALHRYSHTRSLSYLHSCFASIMLAKIHFVFYTYTFVVKTFLINCTFSASVLHIQTCLKSRRKRKGNDIKKIHASFFSWQSKLEHRIYILVCSAWRLVITCPRWKATLHYGAFSYKWAFLDAY